MPFTETDLATIDSAIAKGELEVQFVDRRVRYRSIDELKESRKEILRALAAPRHKQQLAYASKGFGPCV